MAIDAKVAFVRKNFDGSGELHLIDRPAKNGGSPGVAGQPRLSFPTSPPDVGKLAGLEVWGGCDSLLLGDVVIAKREGYNRIVFREDAVFLMALERYHREFQPA